MELFKISKIRLSIKSVLFIRTSLKFIYRKFEIWWINSHLSWIGLIWINTELKPSCQSFDPKTNRIMEQVSADMATLILKVIGSNNKKLKFKLVSERTIIEIDRFIIWLSIRNFLWKIAIYDWRDIYTSIDSWK